MANKERSDALKNKQKIVEEVVKNPFATVREISEKTGIGRTAVSEHLQNLPGSIKDEKIVRITDTDLEIVEIGQRIIKDKLNNEEYVKTARISEISSVIKENTARYTLFRGDATDKNGGAKSISELDLLD